MASETDPERHRLNRGFMSLTGHVNRQWRRVIDRQLAVTGLTEATWLPLVHLARAAAPMRQKDLAASMGLDSSSVVRLLDGLQSGGYIERMEGEDRRVKTVHLTPLGVATAERIEALVSQAREQLFAPLAPKDLATAFRVLETIAATLAEAETAEPKTARA